MIRWTLPLLLIINIAHANDERYFIKLGSFKQLKVLERSIGKLPNHLRSHVVIVRSKNWYIPFAYYTKSKRPLYSEVPKYKRYFPDAFIGHSAYMLQHPVVHNYAVRHQVVTSPPPIVHSQPIQRIITPRYQNVAISEGDNIMHRPLQVSSTSYDNSIKPTLISSESSTSTVVHKRYKSFNKKMLSGNHYYLAYKSTRESPNLLIKVSFGNHQVTYQPIIGDMKMTQANYLIDNNRLYMFAENFTQNGAYSILEEHRNDHFLVSSWLNSKKLNTLRYYYQLNDAKEYLGIEKSKGLASTLQDGSFDEFFIDDEE